MIQARGDTDDTDAQRQRQRQRQRTIAWLRLPVYIFGNAIRLIFVGTNLSLIFPGLVSISSFIKIVAMVSLVGSIVSTRRALFYRDYHYSAIILGVCGASAFLLMNTSYSFKVLFISTSIKIVLLSFARYLCERISKRVSSAANTLCFLFGHNIWSRKHLGRNVYRVFVQFVSVCLAFYFLEYFLRCLMFLENKYLDSEFFAILLQMTGNL